MYVIYQSRNSTRHYAWYDSYKRGNSTPTTLCGYDTANMEYVSVGGLNPVNCKRCSEVCESWPVHKWLDKLKKHMGVEDEI